MTDAERQARADDLAEINAMGRYNGCSLLMMFGREALVAARTIRNEPGEIMVTRIVAYGTIGPFPQLDSETNADLASFIGAIVYQCDDGFIDVDFFTDFGKFDAQWKHVTTEYRFQPED